MNRDTRSLITAAFTLLVGVLALTLTTSWFWPILILVLGGIGLTAALVTPARES
ncbi:DUF4175 domain-containing protein [Nocardia seriolae]|uniref:Uncharacterized protein n=1 Tax=Nocardia seriolae TaxID=37332 RepID=A0A0B8N9P1_9NOCA|nr:DUF4175 domain-containing protein [Nocardia seriolae]APB01575.1 hypothetical protein NS506_07555 [Nocardia seriolae]MTJ60946.1 hypothetical protein [Nocardia seriolae]MTJ71505.1 hypothetical protein [Nocardia seriolae]MTJ90918.1 hypothetical protein [Nocardia seriolae]MTK34874.1 hypothetical protein [Nocardia seriolae]